TPCSIDLFGECKSISIRVGSKNKRNVLLICSSHSKIESPFLLWIGELDGWEVGIRPSLLLNYQHIFQQSHSPCSFLHDGQTDTVHWRVDKLPVRFGNIFVDLLQFFQVFLPDLL